jgi:hypothetical protein
MSKKSWVAALYVVLVFAAGVVAGALGNRVLTGREVSAKTNPPASPSEWRQKHVSEMKTRLKLSESQVEDLNKILDQTRSQYRAARERAKPEMERIYGEQVQRITSMLAPEQRPEYERIVEEHDRQRKLREAGAAAAR